MSLKVGAVGAVALTMSMGALACGSGHSVATDGAAGGAAGAAGTGAAGAGGTAAGGSGGTGGTAGAAPDGGAGGAAGAGGSGGGPTPVACPALPARCAANTVDGDVTISASNPPSNYAGVTHITGNLAIPTSDGITAFDCLETIDIGFTLGGLSGLHGTLANAFPNLRSAGSVDISGIDSPTSITCAFRSLQSVGSNWEVLGQLSGEINLSSLRSFQNILIRNTVATRIFLPSNGTFRLGQLGVYGNSSLSILAGFDNSTLTPLFSTPTGTYSLRLINNPLLSQCRVQQLAQLFLDSGYPLVQITTDTSGPACP